MPRWLSKRVLAIAGVALGLTGVFVAPSPAQAAPICGSGYGLVGHYDVYNDVSDDLDMYLDIYYSSSAKRNCLIVSHVDAWWGVQAPTWAMIRPSGYAWPTCNSTGCDKGNYYYYAGPVYTPAGLDMSHRCIDVYGEFLVNTHKALYNINCG